MRTRVIDVPATPALLEFLRGHRPRVSGLLACMKGLRFASRVADRAVALGACAVLRGIGLVRVDDRIVEEAAGLEWRLLPSLDTIHRAAAQPLGHDPAGVVVSDRWLTTAARHHGPVVPGATLTCHALRHG